ncbi:toll-like receptor 13 isoform X2 [Clinocottus analis]|uniref:toll-like receptor 13 isoform X2 n=1 Tax=Clinocottus analis TaxID=304258 RepID=UPI0035C22424
MLKKSFVVLYFHLYSRGCHHSTLSTEPSEELYRLSFLTLFFSFFLLTSSGKPIMNNITDAIYGSRKTICVISRRYLESEWCSREIQVASFRLFDEQKDVLILVFLEDIPIAQLSPYYRMRKMLKRRTYLSWTRAGEHPELFWEKLRQALKTGEEPDEDRFLLSVEDRP